MLTLTIIIIYKAKICATHIFEILKSKNHSLGNILLFLLKKCVENYKLTLLYLYMNSSSLQNGLLPLEYREIQGNTKPINHFIKNFNKHLVNNFTL